MLRAIQGDKPESILDMRSRNRHLIAGAALVCLFSIANAQQSGPPISFSVQIAPILAMRCNSCHGDQGIAGGLDTRTWASLMASEVVLAQDPNESLLVQFIEGRRGLEHRMPLGGKPLDTSQVELIRREAAAVQSAAEGANVKAPGEWIVWDLAPERGWPKRLRVELTIAYASSAPVGALLQVCDEIGQVRASTEFKSLPEMTQTHE